MKNKIVIAMLLGSMVLSSTVPAFADTPSAASDLAKGLTQQELEVPDLETPELETPDLETPELETPSLGSGDLSTGSLGSGSLDLEGTGSLKLGDLDIENTDDETIEKVVLTGFDAMFDNMKTALNNGQTVGISSLFNDAFAMSIPAESLLDLSGIETGSKFDGGMVNLQYASMTAALADGFTEQVAAGKSVDCMSLFQSTYGDVLSQIQLENPEIPEGFSVNSIMSAGQSAVNNAYGATTSSGSFAGVKNSVSIGSIFATANNGLSMPELASNGTLQGLIAESDSANKDSTTRRYASKIADINRTKTNAEAEAAALIEENLMKIKDLDETVLGAKDEKTALDNYKKKVDVVNQFNNIIKEKGNSGSGSGNTTGLYPSNPYLGGPSMSYAYENKN